MEVLLYLVPLGLGMGLLGLGTFLWSVRSGQFDDLDYAAWHAILDDEPPPANAARPAVRPRAPPGAPADAPAE